jgi:predicted DNA-binding transcriptional regulator YafY
VGAVSERLERLVNLTATLLDTRRPLTLEELAARLEPSYPEDKVARRRAFSRDKETLRDLGVPITTSAIEGFSTEVGYRIHPGDYYLADPGLSAEERAALHVAVTAVRLEGGEAEEGLRKLGGVEGTGAPALATMEVTAGLGELFDAVARRRVVEFDYRGDARRLEPYGVVHRFGHWYVVGRDQDKDASRAFRIDRFDGPPRSGPDGAFEPPAGFDPSEGLRSDPMTYGDDRPVEARVLVDAARAAWVVDELGDDAVVERRDDGAVVVQLAVVNREAFRAFVVGLLEHAEVLEPPELRSDLIDWLRAVAESDA